MYIGPLKGNLVIMSDVSEILTSFFFRINCIIAATYLKYFSYCVKTA